MTRISNATMKDIAKSLDVSITTVSKVINGHTDISDQMRQKVLDKIAEMGYVQNIMAVNLRRNKANVVALLLSDISKPYFARVIAGYERVLEAAGYQAMTFSSMEQVEREQRLIRQIAAMNMAGIIIDPVQDSDPEKAALKQAGIPYVFSNRFLDATSDYYVAADNETAGYFATRHLIERKPSAPVLCINGPDRISPTTMRYAGFRRALEEAGRSIDEQRQVFHNNFGLEDAYKEGVVIAERFRPPFSIFCSTDQLAIGILRALHDRGLRVPEDVSVIGVDDIETAPYLTPALTTISLPKESIGEQSAEMLIRLIEQKEVEEPRILLKPELMIRETT